MNAGEYFDTPGFFWFLVATCAVLLLVVDRLMHHRRDQTAATRLERLISAHPDPRIRKMFRRVAADIKAKRLRG